MKKMFLCLFYFLISQPNLYAGENIVEFRLAFEKEKPNTEVIFYKEVSRLFVENVPFLTLPDISEVNLIIDDSKPPDWLEQAVKSAAGKIIRPQIKLELVLKESGRKIINQITSENVGKRVAVFVDGNCVMAPVIQGVIDSDRFYITTGYNENEARELVDRINKFKCLCISVLTPHYCTPPVDLEIPGMHIMRNPPPIRASIVKNGFLWPSGHLLRVCADI